MWIWSWTRQERSNQEPHGEESENMLSIPAAINKKNRWVYRNKNEAFQGLLFLLYSTWYHAHFWAARWWRLLFLLAPSPYCWWIPFDSIVLAVYLKERRARRGDETKYEGEAKRRRECWTSKLYPSYYYRRHTALALYYYNFQKRWLLMKKQTLTSNRVASI
jgi:hypothetical protein